MSLDFVIALTDQFSPASAAMAGAAGSLMDKLGELNKGMLDMADAAVPGLGQALGMVEGAFAATAGIVLGGASLALSASAFREDTTATLAQLEGSDEAAKATFANIQNIADSTGQSQTKVADLASKIALAGVTDQKLLDATLKSAADLAAVNGDKGVAKLTSIVEKSQAGGKFQITAKSLAGTGVDFNAIAKQLNMTRPQMEAAMKAGKISATQGIDAMNAAIEDKLGGLAQKKSLELGNQFQTLKNNVSELFDGVDASGFLSSLKDLLSIFSQNTASGQALKAVIVGFFNKFFDIAKKVFPYVKAFFLQLIIAGLKLYISLKPIIKTIGDLFSAGGSGDTITPIITGIADFLVGMVATVVYAVAAFAVFFGSMYAGFQSVIGFVGSAVDAISNLFSGGAEIAGNFVQGLIDGITGGIGKAVDAAKNLAKGAMDAVKGALGIASPSKVMMEMGDNTAAGFTQGVDAAAPDVHSAMQDMVAPPSSPAPSAAPESPAMSAAATAGGAGGKGGGGGTATTLNVGGITITLSGIEGGGKGMEASLAQTLADTFEQIALQMGAAA